MLLCNNPCTHQKNKMFPKIIMKSEILLMPSWNIERKHLPKI